jgi:hypothetical protein
VGSRVAGSLDAWWRPLAGLPGGCAGATEGAGGGADVYVEGDADVGVSGEAGDVGGMCQVNRAVVQKTWRRVCQVHGLG